MPLTVYGACVTRTELLPIVPTVDPGGAVPPDAPHQPQAVRLYAAQVPLDLAPKPAAPPRKHPALATATLAQRVKETELR